MKKSNPKEGKFALSDFFTKEKASNGVKVFLDLPDGTPTADYFVVVGTDSDVFRTAMAKGQRSAMDIVKLDTPEERDNAIYAQTVSVCAHCVIDWSFEQECSYDNVYTLLTEAPYLKRLVDDNIKNRALFFGKNSTAS